MRRHHAWWILLAGATQILALGAGTGCVGGSKGGVSAEDKERLKAYVLDAVPADIPNKLDINFEGKVRLIGFKAEPADAKPGTEVKVTFYWKCEDTVDEGWRLFTHVIDDGNSSPIGNLDASGPLRTLKDDKPTLGPDKWEKGKIYVDEQTYKVPDDVKSPTLSFYTGLWKGEARLRVVSGPNDGTNRAVAGQIKTGVKPPPKTEKPVEPPVPTMHARKLLPTEKVVVDGKADDAVWATAPSTGMLGDVSKGGPNTNFPVNGSVKLLWDDTAAYALFEVKGTGFFLDFKDAKANPALFTKGNQPKLWTKDCVEWMVDPDESGDNKDYYELQFGPGGHVFKSHFDTLQQPSGGPDGPFGHEDWDPKLKSVAVVTKDADGKVSGYTVEVSIPWAGFHKAANKPPKDNEVWRMNFYAMRENSGVAWSPILGKGNFHHAPRFGKVRWVGVPKPAPSASAAASAPRPGLSVRPLPKPGPTMVPPPGRP